MPVLHAEWWTERMKSVVYRDLDHHLYSSRAKRLCPKIRSASIMEIALGFPEVVDAIGKSPVEAQHLLDAYEIRAVRMFSPESMRVLDESRWQARNINLNTLDSPLPFYHPREIVTLLYKIENGIPPVWPIPFQIREPLDGIIMDIFRGHQSWRADGVLERLFTTGHCTGLICEMATLQTMSGISGPDNIREVVEQHIREMGIPHVTVAGRDDELFGELSSLAKRIRKIAAVLEGVVDGYDGGYLEFNTASQSPPVGKISLTFISSSGLRLVAEILETMPTSTPWLLYKAAVLEKHKLPEEEHNRMLMESMTSEPFATAYMQCCNNNFRQQRRKKPR